MAVAPWLEPIPFEYFRCRGCLCLVEGDNGEWICDEIGKEIGLIANDKCPEFRNQNQQRRYSE